MENGKDIKKYCGGKDICVYKEHYVSNECLAYKQCYNVWKTCPNKWKRIEKEESYAIS